MSGTAKIRGLTLRHPWAWAIDRLGKRVENRSWHPSKAGLAVGDHLAIHGGRFDGSRAYKREIDEALHWIADGPFCHDHAPREAIAILAGAEWGSDAFYQAVTPQGIVGVGQLSSVINPGSITDDLWYMGEYGWQLGRYVSMQPVVPHKGAQGCWNLEPEALSEVRVRYRKALLSQKEAA